MSGKRLNSALMAMVRLRSSRAPRWPESVVPPPAPASSRQRADNLPHKEISNGIVSAKVYLPGDGASIAALVSTTGVVAHATYKGTDTASTGSPAIRPTSMDFAWQNGQVTVSPASGSAGPSEEFTASTMTNWYRRENS